VRQSKFKHKKEQKLFTVITVEKTPDTKTHRLSELYNCGCATVAGYCDKLILLNYGAKYTRSQRTRINIVANETNMSQQLG